MISTQTLNNYVTVDKTHANECEISNEEFEQLISEAEEDIENGRLHSQKEVMSGGLEILENRIAKLSKEEQVEARDFINYWRSKFE